MRTPIKIVWPKPGDSVRSADGNVYHIGDRIGEGNFSIVFSAIDDWDNELAVKILKPAGQLFEAVMASFEKEKESLLLFRHPAVTHIYNAFSCENLFYLITERCAYTIKDLIKLDGFNGIGWIKPMARSLLQAVAEIHKLGYVHRDIHLGNVFTSILRNVYAPSSGDSVIRFKLGDFGISRLAKDISPAGTMAVWLRPPEVLRPNDFGPLDLRVDIYHIGLLFLQMLYKSDLTFSEQEVCEGKPKKMALEYNCVYSRVLAKALEPYPEDRYTSAISFWYDIRSLV